MLPILVNERDIEPTVEKKTNQFVFFQGWRHSITCTLGISAVVLPVFTLSSELTKPKRQRSCFPTNGSIFAEKMKNKELPPSDSFFSILLNSNPLEKNYNNFQNLVNSGLTTEQAVAKLRMDRIPPTGADKYTFLQNIWEKNNMQYVLDFLRWYNNKDVVPTLEAMQKMIEFYHKKGIDMLKLGCRLPILANICLHRSRESDKDSL